MAPWGRIPGRLNINGVWEPEVFNALCDAQPGNVFQAGDVTKIFNQMKTQRSPNTGTFSNNPMSFPGPTDQLLVNAANTNNVGVTGINSKKQSALDRPFWGHATGYASAADAMAQSLQVTGTTPPSVRGLDNTLLRPLTAGSTANTTPRTFTVTNTTATHPYQQAELLNKIYNSVTTRSNVFAVYLTVGFFTVTADQTATTPASLAAEVGRSENRQIRHRMFAIVDRSNLTNFTTTSTAAIAAPVTPATRPTVPPAQAIPIATTGTNANTGKTWALQAGMYLTFEPNTNNEETVLVQQGNVASFNLAHASGVTVINRGNPGPWIRYDPRLDGGVVPYFAVVD